MTTNEIPPIPQTGIEPLALPEDQEQRLLSKRRKADQTDPFASDPDDDMRRIGRLALRRDAMHPYDYLALADRCARLSLVERDQRLLVYYVGKTLYGLSPRLRTGRAGQPGSRPGTGRRRSVCRLAGPVYARGADAPQYRRDLVGGRRSRAAVWRD